MTWFDTVFAMEHTTPKIFNLHNYIYIYSLIINLLVQTPISGTEIGTSA